jgi:class 3 adenylate cyclase
MTVPAIADWLEKLGLAQYVQRFVENEIDVSVLRHLTDQDLKDIGVPLGHRRKMLAAIGELAGAAPAAAEPAPGTGPKTQDSAERRQVTVMFSDLVGSTALSARMDPEDLREVISAYQQCVAETVRRFGGFVAKYMGDGVLVYFGYPQAHEDDAERAVRAGLELVAAVAGLKTRASLQTRVGIATGLVVVGDLVGSGEAQERGIVGETPNLAARLQGIAEPDMVVIAEGTRRLLGNLFELEDLGPKDLKGIAGPVRAWAALRASSAEGRFEALHASGLTALVGREEELELLLRRWSRAKTGEGQVVLISGEAGIGKSRLTAALLERLAGEPHTRLRYFCSPQHTDSAFYPVIGQMERAAGLAHDDTPQARLDKLDALLAQTATSTQDAALFAEMLSLPNDGRYPTLDLAPQQRRQRTMETLIAQIEALIRSNPVLMIIEDAHWIDPTSLEVFGRTVDRIKSVRALLIVTFRPEFNAPWVGQSHVTSLALNRLGERETAAIIAHLVGNKELPADVMAEIVERTDGIPLFVEEMTKAVLEAESEGAARQTVSAVPSPALAVPASLQASLMARLDRLGPAKEMVQIAAALGREFSYELLSAVARSDDAKLLVVLDQLVGAGLLFRHGTPPHATFLFKHALIQDAAYGTLLREARRDLHARIARTLHDNFPQTRDTQPEILAHHYFEAGQSGAAVEWRAKAGHRALRRSAFKEAIQQFKTGLKLLDGLPEGVERVKREIDLQTGLGVALTANKGYAAHETGQAYTRARQLCEEIGDTTALVRVGYGQYLYHLMAGEVRQSHRLATETLELAERINNTNSG